jgi:acetyl esterase/lipase
MSPTGSSLAPHSFGRSRYAHRPAPVAAPPASPGVPVRVLLDILYAESGDARNKLDLYLPDRSSFPVVVFAHGGAWVGGDKALHSHVGNFFAKNGIGAAVINYRLAPRVRHPAPVQDLARAFAWTVKHIRAYGGDADRLFLCGHSAGGHLASLLATDEGYLRAENLSLEHVRGVISVSGIYVIHWNVRLYGTGGIFHGVDKAAASPHRNVKPGCPPFLILYAEKEVWTLAGQAVRFHEHLLANRCRSRLGLARGTDHRSVIDNLVLPAAEYGKDVLRFVNAA